MKNTFVFVGLIVAGIFGIQAQDSVFENLSIEVLKAKGVSRNFNVRSLNTSNTKELTKVLTRCQIESLDETPVDVNAFSLLDTRNKIRYKIGDFKAYRAVGGQSKMMLNEEILNEKGKPYGDLPDYDPNHTDSFFDYTFEGYSNLAVPVNFGSGGSYFSKKKKPRILYVHYDYVDYKKFTAEIYFYILTNPRYQPKFELYYGKRLVSEVVF
ncbi:MAG: hypothetical protein VXW38_18170 [Bacteroidota bacterium]|nr:hypothetical protein [Bacteroidota bacterium]